MSLPPLPGPQGVPNAIYRWLGSLKTAFETLATNPVFSRFEGVDPDQFITLDEQGRYPEADGSLITNLPPGGIVLQRIYPAWTGVSHSSGWQNRISETITPVSTDSTFVIEFSAYFEKGTLSSGGGFENQARTLIDASIVNSEGLLSILTISGHPIYYQYTFDSPGTAFDLDIDTRADNSIGLGALYPFRIVIEEVL